MKPRIPDVVSGLVFFDFRFQVFEFDVHVEFECLYAVGAGNRVRNRGEIDVG